MITNHLLFKDYDINHERLLNSGVLDKLDMSGFKILVSKDYKRHFDGYLVLKWDWK